MKTYIVTLGCPKNLVDSEASMSLLRRVGCTTAGHLEDAELLIVNACSFLEASWQETVAEVDRLSRIRMRDPSKKLILMGCLPRHRGGDLETTMPYVDQFVPTGEHGRLPSIVGAWLHGDEPRFDGMAVPDRFAGFEDRLLMTPPHVAYVKIAEGCSRRCSFCAIPKIRGRMVSRDIDSIVREVELLVARGVKEVTLLAQDITSYRSGDSRLPELVDALVETGIEWIRIFYVHPGSLDLALVKRLFEHPSVCRYLEVPIQHASNRVLRQMRRPYTAERLQRLFDAVREEFPDVMLRSEVIVGFPGETDDDYDELKAFVEATRFTSLGIFTYSPEPNTAAAGLQGAVPDAVKRVRASELSETQEAIGFGHNCTERGRTHRILVDRKIESGQEADGFFFAGRHYGQAFEIDGEVLLRGGRPSVGSFVNARITDSDVFDLKGQVLAEGRQLGEDEVV